MVNKIIPIISLAVLSIGIMIGFGCGGGGSSTGSSSTIIQNITINEAGNTVTETVTTDSSGNTSTETVTSDPEGNVVSEETVTNNAPNVPSISAPSSASAGASVAFTFTRGVDPDGDQVAVFCAFGDGDEYFTGAGAGGTTKSTTHRYSSAGTYTISCSSMDDPGLVSATVSQDITIT